MFLSFDIRLKRANLASHRDIANFVNKADFNNQVKKSNKNELSKKLSKKVKATKWLTKDLIDKFSILNGAKYFSSGIFQNCLVFIPTKNTLDFLVALLRLIDGNLMECHKKILKT